MPDRRHHRGAHPEDAGQFGPAALPALREATADLSWMLGRAYAMPGALKLVGDRYTLTQRQRTAIMRAACSDADRDARRGREMTLSALAGQRLLIDGYNLITTIETALGGGVILACRDGACRDIASIHGTYRKVDETPASLELIGRTLNDLNVAEASWYLDSPVSNSGRLKALMEQVAAERGWNWQVQLVVDPDYILSRTPKVIATADSVILDRCERWANLARQIIRAHVPDAWMIELG